MAKRLLILRAGTGASNNLIHSLRVGDPSLVIVGAHSNRLVLKKSNATRNYVIPELDHPDLPEALSRIVEREQIDLLVPNSDPDVKFVSDLRDALPCRVFLPRPRIIELCQDKYELTVFLRSRGLPAPETYPVTDLDTIEDLFRRLGPASRLWCRIRAGSGSTGALPVKSPDQARSWILYWQEMRGYPATSFTLSEYLPGRDFSLQCLWHDGRLVLVKMSERLSYFVTGNNPSGVSSTPAVAKTVFEPRVVDVCSQVIRALDDRASGIFCFDIKEDVRGIPFVTEINAGRFAMITPIYDLTGKHNMAVTYVRLALGERVEVEEVVDIADHHYLVRDLDTTPGVFNAEQLFVGIDEALPATQTSTDHLKGGS